MILFVKTWNEAESGFRVDLISYLMPFKWAVSTKRVSVQTVLTVSFTPRLLLRVLSTGCVCIQRNRHLNHTQTQKHQLTGDFISVFSLISCTVFTFHTRSHAHAGVDLAQGTNKTRHISIITGVTLNCGERVMLNECLNKNLLLLCFQYFGKLPDCFTDFSLSGSASFCLVSVVSVHSKEKFTFKK